MQGLVPLSRKPSRSQSALAIGPGPMADDGSMALVRDQPAGLGQGTQESQGAGGVADLARARGRKRMSRPPASVTVGSIVWGPPFARPMRRPPGPPFLDRRPDAVRGAFRVVGSIITVLGWSAS